MVTIGTDLAYGAVTKTFGGWRHLRAGHVDVRLSWWLAAGSVLGTLSKAGVPLSPALLAGIPAALAVLPVVIDRRRSARVRAAERERVHEQPARNEGEDDRDRLTEDRLREPPPDR